MKKKKQLLKVFEQLILIPIVNLIPNAKNERLFFFNYINK